MRGNAMKRLCNRLEEKGIDLRAMHALEFFAREGDWQTVAYANKVRSLDAWEINPDFKANLERNLPSAHIVIGNSFDLAKKPENRKRFDFIVFDNPQELFGPGECYCEHFEALELVPVLMSKKSVVVFNVNKKPFDYEKYPKWRASRERFYCTSKTEKMDASFLLDFYKRLFLAKGLETIFSFEEKRNREYLSYLVLILERKYAL